MINYFTYIFKYNGACCVKRTMQDGLAGNLSEDVVLPRFLNSGICLTRNNSVQLGKKIAQPVCRGIGRE